MHRHGRSAHRERRRPAAAAPGRGGVHRSAGGPVPVNLVYEACRPVMAGLLWTLADFRLEGDERVPRTGPLIVASNHLHLCDPPLLGGVLPRYVRFMA